MRLFDIKGWETGRPVKRKSWPYAKQTSFSIREMRDYTTSELSEFMTAQDWEPVTLFGDKKVYLHEYTPSGTVPIAGVVMKRVVTPMPWESFSEGTNFSLVRTVEFDSIRDIDA